MLNTLPTHPQTHLQQLSSLTQRQQRPGNKHKSQKTGVLHCQCHSQPLLLAVIFECLNSNLLVLCSTQPQHMHKHIRNSFPHLHNVNRSLETSKHRKNRKNQGIVNGKQANSVTVHLQQTQNSLRGARSAQNCKNTLHTHSTSSFKPLSSYTTRQTRSANKQKSKKWEKTAFTMEKQANSQKHHFAEARNRSHRS